MSTPLLEVVDLTKHFVTAPSLFGSSAIVRAVDGISFTIGKGETLALVGESGCGKSTVGRAILRLCDITKGSIILDGLRIDHLPARILRPLRRRIQVIFQDASASLNPRLRVREMLAEPIQNFQLAKSAREIDQMIDSLLDRVRLSRDAANRWPHEFSGGQRQRIAIARALATQPDLIVCDEAVSALDASVKAQIVNLLTDLQREIGLSLLFISHDLAIVEHIAHRVAVMYLGKIVEMGPTRAIFGTPKHPYTKALLSAVPNAEPDAKRRRIILKGEPPSATCPPAGCMFHTRCVDAFARCRIDLPKARPIEGDQIVACHLNEPEADRSSQFACTAT
jgi:peptide/nickel transport system ATP-binding protein